MKLFDAHNHLQDERFQNRQQALIEECRARNIAGMVVNGSSEEDWDTVRSLASLYPEIIPAFGCHPWHLGSASKDWFDILQQHLALPGATIGETGLDRWKKGLDFEQQVRFFTAHIELAHRFSKPVSIHCLNAWGPLYELLKKTKPPEACFLLHSYSGSIEMIQSFIDLGAYFSCAGNYLAPSKRHKLEVFSHVPLDRLLVETDAPDQLLPAEADPLLVPGSDTSSALNHPANLPSIYKGLAELRKMPLSEFTDQISQNFQRLFNNR